MLTALMMVGCVKISNEIKEAKKVQEILPVESADMIWVLANPDLPMIRAIAYENSEKSKYYEILPAWSLAALLNAVDFSTINLHYDNARIDWVASATIHDSTKHCTKYESTRADNPVDACYEMIIKLNEESKI